MCRGNQCLVNIRLPVKTGFGQTVAGFGKHPVVTSLLFTAHTTDYEQIQYQTQQSADHKLSTETVADWLSYCCEICLEIVARQMSQLIGGPGLTVKVYWETQI